jgi:UDP-N-acetylmuramoylalanine--D-glutamate ligase
MKIGLVGWGVETKSAYSYFGAKNEYVICNEHDSGDFPDSANTKVQYLDLKKVSGDAGSNNDLSYLHNLGDCDQIIYSPVAWNNLIKVYYARPEVLAKMKTAQHIFFENVDNKKIIGVTGTKGKSTTATLIYEFLKAAGKNVYLGGNIGVCPLDFIDEMKTSDAIAVLELSSYQLNDLPFSPHVAVLLNITPEHLDWHGSMESYIEAKSHITTAQTNDDILIYNPTNESCSQVASNTDAKSITYPSQDSFVRDASVGDNLRMAFSDDSTIDISDTKIKGKHNLLNIEAAAFAYSIYCSDTGPIKEVLLSFAGLEHRLEFVATIDGVDYVNDSIASTPDACIAGIKSFSKPVVVLVGGHDRGLDLSNFVIELINMQQNIRAVICFGEVRQKLQGLLEDKLPCTIVDGRMDMVVPAAREQAQSGDAVLLSPGFSSYDMYTKFTVRGEEFKKNVLKLETS